MFLYIYLEIVISNFFIMLLHLNCSAVFLALDDIKYNCFLVKLLTLFRQFAKSSALPFLNKNPFLLSFISSLFPSLSLPITILPLAIASTRVWGIPSLFEGRMNIPEESSHSICSFLVYLLSIILTFFIFFSSTNFLSSFK